MGCWLRIVPERATIRRLLANYLPDCAKCTVPVALARRVPPPERCFAHEFSQRRPLHPRRRLIGCSACHGLRGPRRAQRAEDGRAGRALHLPRAAPVVRRPASSSAACGRRRILRPKWFRWRCTRAIGTTLAGRTRTRKPPSGSARAGSCTRTSARRSIRPNFSLVVPSCNHGRAHCGTRRRADSCGRSFRADLCLTRVLD